MIKHGPLRIPDWEWMDWRKSKEASEVNSFPAEIFLQFLKDGLFTGSPAFSIPPLAP
jgi:hypothetical protein